jgi:dTDP-4-dehydrorhamnose 3,5-epimerase
MINNVFLKDLTVHADERGKLFEILRADNDFFAKFGQAYITVCKPGWVKGWHYHKLQTDLFCIVRGKCKIVLYDNRKTSSTYSLIDEYILSDDKPQLLRIPKRVIHGFECAGKTEAWILNMPDQLYNRLKPDEYRILLNSKDVPYKPWQTKKGW